MHVQHLLLYDGYGRREFGAHRINWVRIIIGLAYLSLSAIGVISNILVAYVLIFLRRRALQNITNIFVLVLALSDLILAGFCTPIQAYYDLSENLLMNNVSCKIIFATFGIPVHVSCLTILLITCDRYQIIIYPLFPRMTRRIAIFLVLVIILFSVSITCPIAIFSSSDPVMPPFKSNETLNVIDVKSYAYCVENWPSGQSRLIYSVAVFLVSFFIPLLLTVVLYGHVFIRLHERHFRRASPERKNRTNKILVRIVICFVVCWTPWTIYSLWIEFHSYKIQQHLSYTYGNHRLIDLIFSHIFPAIKPTEMYSTQQGFHDPKPSTMSNQSTLNSKLNGLNFSLGLEFNENIWNSFSNHSSAKKLEFIEAIEQHLPKSEIKLIDLILRMFAISSTCVNPWLYGWLNKFIALLYKRLPAKRFRAHDLRIKRQPFTLLKKHRVRKRQMKVDHIDQPATSCKFDDTTEQQTGEHIDYGEGSKNSIYHKCYCFAAFCACKCVLSRRSVCLNSRGTFARHGLFPEKCCMHHNQKISDGNVQLKVDSCNKHCEKHISVSVHDGSHALYSAGGQQKTSKHSAEGTGKKSFSDLSGAPKSYDRKSNGADLCSEQEQKECNECTGYKNIGQRYYSRLSATSFGTTNYPEPSTKQTSLLTSGFIPTPRESFLRPNDSGFEVPPTTTFGNLKNVIGTHDNDNDSHVIPKTVIRSSSSGENIFDYGDKIYDTHTYNLVYNNDLTSLGESSGEFDGNIITLQCPILRPKQDLLTVPEQPDSNIEEQEEQSAYRQELSKENSSIHISRPGSVREHMFLSGRTGPPENEVNIGDESVFINVNSDSSSLAQFQTVSNVLNLERHFAVDIPFADEEQLHSVKTKRQSVGFEANIPITLECTETNKNSQPAYTRSQNTCFSECKIFYKTPHGSDMYHSEHSDKPLIDHKRLSMPSFSKFSSSLRVSVSSVKARNSKIQFPARRSTFRIPQQNKHIIKIRRKSHVDSIHLPNNQETTMSFVKAKFVRCSLSHTNDLSDEDDFQIISHLAAMDLLQRSQRYIATGCSHLPTVNTKMRKSLPVSSMEHISNTRIMEIKNLEI